MIRKNFETHFAFAEEARCILGMTKGGVATAVFHNRLVGIKIDRFIIFEREELERYLNQTRRKRKSEKPTL